MSVKVVMPKGPLAWGVWRGLVHYPEQVLTEKEIHELALEANRQHYDERHKAKQTRQEHEHRG